MSPGWVSESEFCRICRLINDSLHSFTESENLSISKQDEKTILLILSQVSNETRRLIHSTDTDTSSPSNPSSQNHPCLSKPISHLIALLTLESQYIQHLAGSVLVTLSEYLASSLQSWEFFIRSLCISFELSVSNAFSCSFKPSITVVEGSCYDLSSFVVLLKPKLKSTSLLTVAGIIRILRNILKFLKEDCDDELVLVFLNSINFSVLNAPWDSMVEIFGGNCGEKDEPRTLFLGNFVQLLCSLVEQFSSAEGLDDSIDKRATLSKIINLLPKLLSWCLCKKAECVNIRVSRYFRHKLLVLMIRLSFQIPLEYSVLVSWLHLLHSYFEDLLCQSLTKVENQDDCLEDSPFMSSNFDGEVHSMHSRHLQRLAVFLFLRFSFGLINPAEDASKHYPRATVKSYMNFDAISEQSCNGREKGLLELDAWLSGHVPVDKLVRSRDKFVNFSLSLLKLYMHEDDILFKFLLELFSLHACGEQQFQKERRALQDETGDVLFHVSYIFNPIRLFHLFLAEAGLLHPNFTMTYDNPRLRFPCPTRKRLHYDHEVLLDYLISKDTGISCAEYLLRCLRIICGSWQIFTEFSVCGKLRNQLSSKRRKVFSESSKFKIEPSSGPVNTIPLSLENKFKGDIEFRHTEQIYELAKGCLLSLKKSIENLHLKNLFPYNPEVLLKRLARFQELCFKQ